MGANNWVSLMCFLQTPECLPEYEDEMDLANETPGEYEIVWTESDLN